MANGAKRKNSGNDSGGANKKRNVISLETKRDFIRRYEAGETLFSTATTCGMNRSTIATIVNQKDKIKEFVLPAGPLKANKMTKRRGLVLEEMEKLLAVWIEDQHQRRVPLSLLLIQEKAMSLFSDVKDRLGVSSTSTDEPHMFTASHGWFSRFKNRSNLHNVKVVGEAASADQEAVRPFPSKFVALIEEENYSPEQVFNVDETGLFWKRMPDRTYISREEKTASGFKAAKDRLTLLLGSNAAGNCRIKPLLVYHSENPRAFKRVDKSSLPVNWKNNRKAWVTRQIFQDWFVECFIPEVRAFCQKKEIPFHILLLDNAPGHPEFLDDLHADVKVMYLPPNTTAILQPMDQGAIATFKKYYLRQKFSQAVQQIETRGITLRQWWKEYDILKAVRNIGASWTEVSDSTLSAVWHKLLPTVVSDASEFEEEIQSVVRNVVSLGNDLQLDIDEGDVRGILDAHADELSNEDLLELEEQRKKQEEEEAQQLGNVEHKGLTRKILAEAFALFEKGLGLLEHNDPDVARFHQFSTSHQELLAPYMELYKEKKGITKQLSIALFFKLSTRSSSATASATGATCEIDPTYVISSDEETPASASYTS